MTDARRDPDELLLQVREAEQEASRGKLTIFFGAAPGVGKTYAMLEAARSERDLKRDVVVGIVETHGRYETASLVLGLELLPRRHVEYKGISLEEFDVDAALERRPGVILVDELAHTNVEGSRHAKRWQDVEELLDAGIDVYSTLNVQHLESLNDVVAQITGVVVRETIPDSVFDKSYEVRVIDLPVDELLERLHEGKVYVPHQALRATEHFFKEGNLIALRELALRRTAERVDAKMRGYRAAHGIQETWHTAERVIVCISSSPHSARLVRAARRMATSLHADWAGVYVETPASIRLSSDDRERLAQHVRLVESLGGEMVVLRGDDAAREIVGYARKRNATKIVVGKPTHPRWRDLFKPSFLEDVVRQSQEVDVYVISGLSHEGITRTSRAVGPSLRRGRPSPAGYVAGVGIVAVTTLIAWLVFGRSQLTDVPMVLLLGVVVAAMRFGYGPALLAAVLSVVSFDLFFIAPYFSFGVSDLRHAVTFAVMFVVAVVISHLTKRIREQADRARERELRMASLYAISRELGLAQSREDLISVATKHVREVFGVDVAVLLPRSEDKDALEIVVADGERALDDKDLGVAQWVWSHQRPAGAGTDTLPSSRALVVPLSGAHGPVGVLALFHTERANVGDPDRRQTLETFSGLIGSSLERVKLAEEARGTKLRMETEQLRNALLSSVSHDLRTPLAVVTGATSALLEKDAPKDEATRRELLETAHEESLRLNRLVRNLLDMTRLESGALKVHKSPESLEELVGGALQRTEDRLRGREVTARIPLDIPLVPLDPTLVEQVLINLLENATKYTPEGSPIEISVQLEGSNVQPNVLIEVADRGPGIPPSAAAHIFDKFYRAHEREGGGVGLGLTICRGIVTAHGGRIWVEERPGGGTLFRFTLPLGSP